VPHGTAPILEASTLLLNSLIFSTYSLLEHRGPSSRPGEKQVQAKVFSLGA
jgi:hypothetical protein